MLSKITIEDLKGSRVSIFGIWQPFDDGSLVKFSNLQSSLSLLGSELERKDDVCTLIIGDFNADFSRGKRYDREIGAFMEQLGFKRLVSYNGATMHTYRNGSRCATIDQMFANEVALQCSTNFRVIVDDLDLSDHRPIACTVQLWCIFCCPGGD